MKREANENRYSFPKTSFFIHKSRDLTILGNMKSNYIEFDRMVECKLRLSQWNSAYIIAVDNKFDRHCNFPSHSRFFFLFINEKLFGEGRMKAGGVGGGKRGGKYFFLHCLCQGYSHIRYFAHCFHFAFKN